MSHGSSVLRRPILGHRKCGNKPLGASTKGRKNLEDKHKVECLFSALCRKIITK